MSPAGFQYAEVTSSEDATAAFPIESCLAPTPMAKNSLLYFKICAFELTKTKRNKICTIFFFNLVS